MADRASARAVLRTGVVWQVLRAALAERAQTLADTRPPGPPVALRVLDAGGGTGGFAVPIAELGHRVTVVDPNPDSLAALERRAAEAGVSELVQGVQGDAAGLGDVVETAGYDVVVCHSVLEVVDDPAEALAAVARAVRSGGLVSVLAATRVAAVLARILTGRVGEAAALLADPQGAGGAGDPVRRRFDLDELCRLLRAAGLVPGPVHGVRVLSDLVPGALLDGDPTAVEALTALESRVAELPPYRDLATQLHVLAVAR